MSSLIEKLEKSYKPVLAIIVYSPDDRQCNAYLESHEIDSNGRLLEGRPLEQATIQGIVDVFFDDKQNRSNISGIVPHNLLSFEILPGGHYKMVWYRPAERRMLHFSDQLNISSGEAWVPAMLYVVRRDSLDVHAMVNDDRPDENTPLYRAPFHNVSMDGDVCLGSAKVKKPEKKTFQSVMKYWEDMFWLSEFTHITGNASPVKGNLNMLWQQFIKSPDLKWEALEELLPTKNTIKSIIK